MLLTFWYTAGQCFLEVRLEEPQTILKDCKFLPKFITEIAVNNCFGKYLLLAFVFALRPFPKN